jgi:hypothetical protein
VQQNYSSKNALPSQAKPASKGVVCAGERVLEGEIIAKRSELMPGCFWL